MTQTPDTNTDFQKEVLERLDRLTIDLEKSNDRIDAYQKASNQFVNLAFTVITAAAAVTILSPAVKAIAEYFTR